MLWVLLLVLAVSQDLRELKTNPSPNYVAAPLDDNLLEWHFTIRGPPDTEFEGGIFHGRILLPPEYPFKPPNIMLLTPNGRFETRKMICLSISAFHPETWQPAWGIRLILEALISFMPTPGEGAVGALDYAPAERRKFAAQSHTWECSVCGPIRALLPAVVPTDAAAAGPSAPNPYAAEIAKMHMHAVPPPASEAPAATVASDPTSAAPPPTVAPTAVPPPVAGPASAPARVTLPPHLIASKPPRPPCDALLTVLAWALFACILCILYRKAVRVL